MITALKHWSGHRVILTFLAVFALTFGPISPLQQVARAATVTGLTTKSALVSAITAATAGDTLVLGSDIVVDSAAIGIAKNITIDGNGYTMTVPNVGVLDDGTNSTSASTWGVLAFTTGSSGATVRNLTIKGGNSSTGAVNIGAGQSITIQSCNITNSRNSGGGGGGIKNSGTLFLRDTNVIRNSAGWGGGFQNSGSIYVDRSSFTENRSESGGGGGGAGENTGAGSYLYVNNSTFANNVSSEIGGAINNYQGNLYAVNSTFTGNVTVAYSTYGGAIGKNGGTVKVASSLFAYNYSLSGGSSSSPTAYQLDDIDYGPVTLAYSMYHGVVYSSSTKVQNVQYTAAADGSNDTIFSGGTNGKVTNGSGVQIGTATVFRPALTTVNGRRVVAIKTGSLPIGVGTPTYYGTSAGRFSYYDRLAGTPAWVSMLGSATSADLVTTDQLGTTRSGTTPTAGAVETGGTALYVVKSIAATDGTVDGGASIYGNTYASGTSVTVTALPNAGKVFSKWQVVVGSSASVDVTSNPYTFSVTANTTLTPVFAAAPVNTYTVSYSANNATAGSPPSAQTFTVGGSALTAASNSGSLSRTGYSFGGWSTTASGSGTIYAAGSGTFTPSANMTLYAYWVPPAAPSISVGSSSYSLTTGSSATITPTNAGGAANSWSISPSAPAGMNFGTSTGVLTGTPTTVQSSTSYTITATNVTGSATATFTIAIADPVVVTTIYSVTYNYNSATGGNSTSSDNFTVGGSALTLPSPTKTGYAFGGWYSESALTNQVGNGGGSYSPSADVVLYAKWTAGTYTVTYNYNLATGGNGVSSDSFTTGSSAITLPTPTRTSFQFQGWYDANTGGNLVGAGGASFTTTASTSLYARWIQSSLAGIDPGDFVLVGTISASNLVDATFGATTNGSSVNVSVPTGALPNGTTITMNLVTNFTRVQNILTDAHNYVVSLVVSWLAPDGTVPTTATGKPISMTISNSSIHTGDAIYLVMNGTATLVGRATSNGQVVLSVTDDPEIVIASTRPYSVTNVTATNGDVESATISWTAPSVDGGSAITGYTVTSSGGQTCTTTTTSCTVTGLTGGNAYTFTVVANNAVGSAVAATSSSITPVAATVVSPPVSAPVTPPVTTPVVPPVTTPVTPPVTEPVTPPVTEPVTPPVTKPIAAAKTISLGSSAIGTRLNKSQVATLKALKAKKGFTVTVYTAATLKSIASRISGAIKASFSKLKTTTTITGGSKLKCAAPNGVCVAITATK
jgi:uncharacterized repeat protein (TIGR02543 family)